MGVAGQWNIGVVCVQKGKSRVHLYVFKGSAHDVRSNGVEGLPACLLLGLALHHLPQAENHAVDDNQHKVAAQDHTCHSDHPAQQRENLAAQLAAGPLSLNMPVRRLMKNPQASALLQAVLGDMWQAIVSNPLSQGISLREISGFLQAALPESALNQLDAQLAKILVE